MSETVLKPSASTLIDMLDVPRRENYDRHAAFAMACEEARRKWENLGRVGGKRADSAGEFLKDLLAPIVELRRHCEMIERTLRESIANPWGDE